MGLLSAEFSVVERSIFLTNLMRGPHQSNQVQPNGIPGFVLMNEYNQEAKELLKNEDGKKAVFFAGRVFAPHTFSDQIPDFSSKQYVFLNHYSLKVPLEEAAEKAGLSPEQADRFLDRKDVQGWLTDRALKNHIKTEWEVPGKLYKELDDVYEGRKVLRAKAQMDALKLLAERVAPPKRNGDEHAGVTFTFNFGADSVKAAIDRQAAIEAEISNE